MTLKRISVWMGASVIALAAICGPTLAQTKAPTKIRLGYSAASSFGNAYVAADQGIFAKHGLDVEMVLVPNSSTTPAALVAESLQIATPTQPVTLQAIENGLDLVVVAGGAVVSPTVKDVGVMVRVDSTIKTAKDFEGKKVGNPGLNGFLHILFRDWMTKNGGDWKKVTFIEVPFATLGDVLKAGQIDAALTAEPFMSRIADTKSGVLLSNYAIEVGSGFASGWYVASRSWADANRPAALAFQTAIAEATELATKDPAILRKAIGVYTKLPEAVLAQIPLSVQDDKMPPKKIDDWNKLLASQEMLKAPIPAAKVVWK